MSSPNDYEKTTPKIKDQMVKNEEFHLEDEDDGLSYLLPPSPSDVYTLPI